MPDPFPFEPPVQLNTRVPPHVRERFTRLQALTNYTFPQLMDVFSRRFEQQIVSKLNEIEKQKYLDGKLRFEELVEIRDRHQDAVLNNTPVVEHTTAAAATSGDAA
jgi:hypothetical protein